MITDYSSLKSVIANWLARTDLEPVIPDFIAMCEAELNRVLFAPEMEAFAETVTSEQYVTLPQAQEIRRLAVDGEEIQLVTPEQLYVVRSSLPPSGKPRYAVVAGNVAEMHPTPDAEYTYQIIYKETIPALSDDKPTNWLLLKHPDAYLYGSLTHSAPYLHHDERVGVWSVKFENVVRQINTHNERAQYPTSTWRAKLRYVT
jgi:hypothetical protein